MSSARSVLKAINVTFGNIVGFFETFVMRIGIRMCDMALKIFEACRNIRICIELGWGAM